MTDVEQELADLRQWKETFERKVSETVWRFIEDHDNGRPKDWDGLRDLIQPEYSPEQTILLKAREIAASTMGDFPKIATRILAGEYDGNPLVEATAKALKVAQWRG